MLGDNIGKIIKAKNLNIDDIVNYINNKYNYNINRYVFRKIIHNKKALSLNETEIIADSLGVPVEDIFNEEKYKNYKSDYELENEKWLEQIKKYPELKNILLLIDEFAEMEEDLENLKGE